MLDALRIMTITLRHVRCRYDLHILDFLKYYYLYVKIIFYLDIRIGLIEIQKLSSMEMNKNNDIIDKLVLEWNRERPELNVESMHIVGRLIKLGKILEKKASAAVKKTGIHYTDLDVLATIRRSGFPYELSPKELMESVLITSGAMTTLLERLSKLDLIYRAPDKRDGRIKLAGLTEKGIKTIDQAIVLRFDQATESVKNLVSEDREKLTILLKKLLFQLEKQ